MEDEFDEEAQAKKWKKLSEELAKCPIVELTGIVDPSGVGGSQEADGKDWELMVFFVKWRIGKGSIQESFLDIRCRVSEQDFHIYQDQMEENTVVKIQARVAEKNVFGRPMAQFEEFIQIDTTDTELHKHLAELQKPVTYEDNFFGLFTYDRRLNRFNGSSLWNGELIELTLSDIQTQSVESAMSNARKLWNEQTTWNKRVNEFAIQDRLPNYNEVWLDDDEIELTPEQFLNRITLEQISIDDEGNFEFWYIDGSASGSSICITGTLTDGPKYSDFYP